MNISCLLNGVNSTTHHKIKCYSGIECASQHQQRNLCKLQKKKIGSIWFTIVMGNQDLSIILKILKILNNLVVMIYLVFYPLTLANIDLILKLMNMLRKEGTSQIMIHFIQCMLIFHNIMSNRWMLISSKTILRK